MWSTLFLGSYTEYPIPGFGGVGLGIYTTGFNYKTGEIKPMHVMKARNPSYLALSDDNCFLYCVTELPEDEHPVARAYAIKADFSLEFLNEQPIPGGFPCHLAVHQQNVFVACYSTGNVIQYPLDAKGMLEKAKYQYGHEGGSIHKMRQLGPHAHQIVIHPNNREVYVCDLGIDTIKAYRYNNQDLVPDSNLDCKVTKGGGPRHLVFDGKGNRAYVINELTAKISVLERKGGAFMEIGIYASLPNGFRGTPSGSAIRLHPNGHFLYVANRGGETITSFAITGNELKLMKHTYTLGEELREFNISPDGKWLLACHQNSHDIVVYHIEPNGMLTEAYRTKEILSPVCVVFSNRHQ